MKSKIELEQDIIKIINTIHNDYPELTKYISEMPDKDSGDDNVNTKNFEVYYQSLVDIVKKYSNTHDSQEDFPSVDQIVPRSKIDDQQESAGTEDDNI